MVAEKKNAGGLRYRAALEASGLAHLAFRSAQVVRDRRARECLFQLIATGKVLGGGSPRVQKSCLAHGWVCAEASRVWETPPQPPLPNTALFLGAIDSGAPS